MPAMKWSLLDARESFADHAATWCELNRVHYAGHPLLDARFVGPLVHHFASADVKLAVLGDVRSPEGMLLVEPSRFGLWRGFLPSQSQIAPVLLGPQHAGSLPALIRSLPGRALALDLCAQDPLFSCVFGKPGHRLPPQLVEITDHARTMSVPLDGGFDRYWASRSRNLVKNMRRYQARLERDDVLLELEVATSPDEVVARVDDYGRLESAGWKGGAGTALHPDNVQGRFYAEVMRAFAASGDARVYSLLHGGRMVACRLVLRSARMLVILKTTYDETLGRFAPGRLLLLAALRDMFERDGRRVVEFYTNATPEQLAWATYHRDIGNLRLYRTAADRWTFERVRGLGRLAQLAAPARTPAPGDADARDADAADVEVSSTAASSSGPAGR